MPWISKDMCTGCGECIDVCTVGAISMDDNVACIDEDQCIRCAVCHDACTYDAVRHDGERIPEEVETNMKWVRRLLEHEYYLNDKDKQKGLVKRLQHYFGKNRKVMEKTIAYLENLQNTEYAD
jgi:ferredoxin